MSEHELSTMLRDHLADEPPVGLSSTEAIRAGHRQRRLRLAVTGGAAVVLLGAGAVVVPGLGGDDGGAPGRAKDDAPAATQAGASLPELLESVAADRLAPLVGALGAPTWDVTDVTNAPVDAASGDAQYFQLGYHPANTAELHLRVGGFAEADVAFFLAPACPTSEEEGVVSSCTDETLPDGTVVSTAVGPHTRVTNTGSKLPTVQWALRHPDKVLWARSITVSTPDGVTTSASEYVEATAPETADWKVPEDILRGIATDPDLTDPAGVAHQPFA